MTTKMGVKLDTDYGPTMIQLGPIFKRSVHETKHALCDALHIIEGPIAEAKKKIDELRDAAESEAIKISAVIDKLEAMDFDDRKLEERATLSGLKTMQIALNAIVSYYKSEDFDATITVFNETIDGLDALIDRENEEGN